MFVMCRNITVWIPAEIEDSAESITKQGFITGVYKPHRDIAFLPAKYYIDY